MAMPNGIATFLRSYMQTEFCLYKVDMKYIRNLHNKDDKVLSVSPQTGKDTRVFVGIIIVCDEHKYCIPLSSPKAKHRKMRNSMDFTKIEMDGELLGVLNFNLMIPVDECLLQEIDVVVRKRDRENIKNYKNLCQKELSWCREHSEVICNKANVLYKKCISGEDFSGKERCLDFIKLEKECQKFISKAENK